MCIILWVRYFLLNNNLLHGLILLDCLNLARCGLLNLGKDILRVGYCGICHVSLVFSDYIRVFRRVFIQRKYKQQKLENSKQFKAVFEEFLGFFFNFSENLRETAKIFGKLRKSLIL